MANTKISNLPAAASLTGSDLMPVVQSGVTKKGTFDQIPFLQAGTGAVARTAQAKMRDVVSVKDFGAVGDGVADDTAAIQAAVTASSSGAVHFPKGSYKVSAQITPTAGISIFGDGQDQTTVTATAAMESVFSISGRVVFEGLYVHGGTGRLADYGIKVQGGNGSVIRNTRIESFKYDGVFYAATSNNNNASVENCLIRIGGQTYSTGSVSGTTGGTTLTVTGAADLTTVGMRAGFAYVKIGSDTEKIAYEVIGLTANTITVYPTLLSSPSGSTYELLDGNCVNISRYSDNNRITVRSCSLQSVPVAGILDYGLYGALSYNNVTDSCGYGRVIGRRSPPYTYANYGALSCSDYYENSVHVDILYAYALGNNLRIAGAGDAFTNRVFSGSTAPVSLSSTPESLIPATGITFPATQTPSSDANTLDDYEEGNFTPEIIGTTGAGTGTYSVQTGRYTRVGNVVHVTGYVVWSAHTGTGNMQLGGFPFASNSTSTYRSAVALGYVNNIALTAGNTLAAMLAQAKTAADFWQLPTGGGAAATVPIDTAGGVSFSCSYQV